MNENGDFDIEGRSFHYEIERIRTYDGEEFTGREMGEYITEADQVFYRVTDDVGDEYYRWLGGPFMDIGDVEQAIIDETEVYA